MPSLKEAKASKVFHGKDAETAYADYILGKRTFLEVSEEYKRH
jgi:hypothetical protein